MVKAEQIVKYFGRFCALDHVDLHVPKGAVYGLVGPNGAGKSTMIRHIMGIYRPFLGRVLIDGEVSIFQMSCFILPKPIPWR